jgi:hypothetical protein
MDHEEGRSRLLSIDDSGIREVPFGTFDAMADEVMVCRPDLILVNPGAFALAGDNLVQELNRLARFEPGYAWTPAAGELPR